jgi:polyhydroxyalkanoate synthesis regulator phasin
MIDLLKKVVFTGVGLASMTKDKIEELGKDIIEAGKLSEKEGKDLMDGLMKKSEEAKKDLEERMDKLVKERLKKMNLVTRDDLLNLEKQVKKLSKALAAKETEE